jgi:hypothetical protein
LSKHSERAGRGDVERSARRKKKSETREGGEASFFGSKFHFLIVCAWV